MTKINWNKARQARIMARDEPKSPMQLAVIRAKFDARPRDWNAPDCRFPAFVTCGMRSDGTLLVREFMSREAADEAGFG